MSPVSKSAVEAFLFEEAALLDGHRYEEWSALFTATGIYWVPLTPDQPDWQNHVSLFCEDATMRDVRRRRLENSNAWSQQPPGQSARSITNIRVEAGTRGRITARSTFVLIESNMRHEQRVFGGRYRHDLVIEGSTLRIECKRVDIVNAGAAHECLEVFL
jgi:benzoate/toluate 1,2-dioxygenase beta subunit